MLEVLKNAWKIVDLRKKILFTLFIIILYRIGSMIPVPYLDVDVIKEVMSLDKSTLFGYFDFLAGGNFSKATLFAMSITPYINASIIINLLTIAIPALEKLNKEGDEGRKKIAQLTRYATVILGLIQGFGYYQLLRAWNAVIDRNFFIATVIIVTFTAGTALIMWLAEQINEKGLGNGISIILFVSILSRAPATVTTVIANLENGNLNYITLPLLLIGALAIIAFVVMMTNAERRIPVQYAKRMVGRKMYGGQSTHIPIKVNMTGVMPIIFASSLASLPATIAMFLPTPAAGSFWDKLLGAFKQDSIFYGILMFLLIIAFNYFYVAVQFNPVEIANNMRKNGGFIPGIRPGKPTSDFISRILSKITLFGAIFLGLIALMPIVISAGFKINIYLGGTTLLIIVGVALETVKTLETQMLMRHYKGFLE